MSSGSDSTGGFLAAEIGALEKAEGWRHNDISDDATAASTTPTFAIADDAAMNDTTDETETAPPPTPDTDAITDDASAPMSVADLKDYPLDSIA